MFDFVNIMVNTGELSYVEDGENRVIMKISSLRKGMATTIGSSIRRVLLSSLPGIAVTGVKFDGVFHEFSSIPNVKQDVVDIILPLKKLRFRCSDFRYLDYSSVSIAVKAQGPKVLTAGDIDAACPSGLSVVDKDLKICDIDGGGALSMVLYLSTGVGYDTYVGSNNSPYGDMNKLDKIADVSRIAVNPCFSSVKSVSMEVHHSPLGTTSVNGLEDLVMVVETDGAINPKDACEMAVAVLHSQFSIFSFSETVVPSAVENNEIMNSGLTEHQCEILAKRVFELELSVRSQNCLRTSNIVYIGELVTKTESEMLKAPNFGKKSLNEIVDVLSEFNLSFGMKIDSEVWTRYQKNNFSSSSEAERGEEISSDNSAEYSDL